MTGPVTSNSTASFVQQFMQFPRQSIPRTLLYSAVANIVFYQLASGLTKIIGDGFEFYGKKRIVVFGALTALFNIVQFKLFNFQLTRVVSLAIGVVITAAMTLMYSPIVNSYLVRWKLKPFVEMGYPLGFVEMGDPLLGTDLPPTIELFQRLQGDGFWQLSDFLNDLCRLLNGIEQSVNGTTFEQKQVFIGYINFYVMQEYRNVTENQQPMPWWQRNQEIADRRNTTSYADLFNEILRDEEIRNFALNTPVSGIIWE